jgi:hypothetical protein
MRNFGIWDPFRSFSSHDHIIQKDEYFDQKITSKLDEKKCSNFENPPFLALYMSNITIFKPNYSR